MVKYTALLSTLITICLGDISSHAFGLSDHTRITSQAVYEFNICTGNPISDIDLREINDANLMEDLNLINKWSKYSHYYRPFEFLDFYWRSDSSARIDSLEADVYPLSTVGAILHFIQDAASPPHVVPISHGLTDGFEHYSVSNLDALYESPTPSKCSELMETSVTFESANQILAESGLATLRHLSELEILTQTKEGNEILDASHFWLEAERDENRDLRPFGQYGSLGNSFGSTELFLSGQRYEVTTEEYDRVKSIFMRSAIDMSHKLLSFWWSKKRPND